MKKNNLVSLILLNAFFLLIIPQVFAEGKAPTPPAAPAASAPVENKTPAPLKVSGNETLDEARSLVEMGKLVEAREHYRGLLTHEGISDADKHAAQKELEALNVKILFSPIQTDDSIVYTVQKGDSLFKIAKKNGTTIDLLRKSNALSRDVIRPGVKLKVSKAKFSIEVDKSDNFLTIFSDGMLFKTYHVATGANASTPVGEFAIENKLENPTWYTAGAVVPSDSPKNVLGTRWMGFSLKGYGIHGTTEPETIGSQASKGCVRMLNAEVEEVYSIIPMGTKVLVKE